MSSILKALRKLEEQKAARPQYQLDISSGIMREKRPGKERRWIVPAGMAAVALAAALGTYSLMALQVTTDENRRGGMPVSSATPPSQTDSAAGEHSRAAIPGVKSSSESLTASGTRLAPDGKAASTAGQGIPASSPPPRKKAPAPEAASPSLPAVRAATPAAPPAVLQSKIVEQQETPSPHLPNLKLTGIAWQKDSASRYAVVNGVAVSQGSIIGGAKIEEILPDKVRFSMGQRSFDLLWGNTPAAD